MDYLAVVRADPSIEVKLVAKTRWGDSTISTVEATYPRFIHAQMMTYRQWSRNAQSSRAIPLSKLLSKAIEVPTFYQNQKGMQPSDVAIAEQDKAAKKWKAAQRSAFRYASDLEAMGVHKQWINRLVEPFTTITAIYTGTGASWEHFFKQRCSPDAQHEISALANAIRDCLNGTRARESTEHTPYVKHSSIPLETRLLLSAARCARVSYVSHDGTVDVNKDLALSAQLLKDGHLSPFEHCAVSSMGKHANFLGWRSYRNMIGQ